MTDYKAAFENVTVVSDETNGLVKLATIERHGQDRKTKIQNNFVGQLSTTDGDTLTKILEILNKKLPSVQDREVVVGLMTSGVIMCGYLAMVRRSRFNYSVHDKFGDYQSAFSFVEGHRDGKVHYLYGIEPGDVALIIEDEVSSGNGVILLTKALREFGVSVMGVGCVVETLNFGARDKILSETGLELKSLIQVTLT